MCTQRWDAACETKVGTRYRCIAYKDTHGHLGMHDGALGPEAAPSLMAASSASSSHSSSTLLRAGCDNRPCSTSANNN